MNGDQSPSPSPQQNETAVSAPSSVSPKACLAGDAPLLNGTDMGVPPLAPRGTSAREEGVADALRSRRDRSAFEGVVMVERPYDTPREGIADLPMTPLGAQKSVICVGSSASCRMSYSRKSPSAVSTSRTASCSPHGWNDTFAIGGEDGEW